MTLYEREATCGGHTLTDTTSGYPVDLGFQVRHGPGCVAQQAHGLQPPVAALLPASQPQDSLSLGASLRVQPRQPHIRFTAALMLHTASHPPPLSGLRRGLPLLPPSRSDAAS